MKFIETRGNDASFVKEVTFSEAILSPIASFGGLYVPKTFPELGESFILAHVQSSYETLALSLLEKFSIDIDATVLAEAVRLYRNFDDSKNPAPVVNVGKNRYICELYHGPTRAFKDMALQPFGSILSSIASQREENYLILAATSGDTGPAALETFKNRSSVKVACLYPDGGTSDVQRLQMVTEDAENLKVIGIKGDFDDAQSALKRLLASPSFNDSLRQQELSLSAANSVNFGRIIFQIIYHFHAYLELVRQGVITVGEKVYLNVPSGNFGNALGGYYAMKMGLPVEKIIIASNANNVLTRLINHGEYDLRHCSVVPTTSPAMDILKSSNIERVLFDMFGANRTKTLMQELDTNSVYRLNSDELEMLQRVFSAEYCSDEEGKAYIKEQFEAGYVMDPHTATCFKAHDACAKKPLASIIYSTAEWTKFAPTVANAVSNKTFMHDKEALAFIESSANVSIAPQISSLFTTPIVQNSVIEKEAIEETILAFISN